MLSKPFPNLVLNIEHQDANPAIQLFGRRFEKDQTEIEYLIEFLLVFINKKEVGSLSANWSMSFPDIQTLENWPNENPELCYHAPVNLILKLFSFLGSSKLETRHSCHQKHFKNILGNLKNQIETTRSIRNEQVLTLIEQVLVGFVGIAQNRTWCTHSFLPISPGLISGETIWKHKEGQKNPDLAWDESVDSFYKYYDFSKHRFMARGGELLFLQICNLFRQTNNPNLALFLKSIGYNNKLEEIKSRLEKGFNKLLSSIPSLEFLSNWIERSDPETKEKTKNLKVKCGWCPTETWPESYLFANEMISICESTIGPLEKVDMLKIACVLQVLRTICYQSARYLSSPTENEVDYFRDDAFSWIVTDPKSNNRPLKDAGKNNLIKVQKMIYGALRNPNIKPSQKGYKIADDQGPNLFLKLGKKIDFIAPWKGPGARFVMNDSLVRFFVLALIPPGNRMTLETFKEKLYLHFGIAVGGEQLDKAMEWTYPLQKLKIRKKDDDWFEEKLRATGFLIPLSDAVSLVINPFSS